VRGAAYTIVGVKGATYYGIGSALARIVDVILHDQCAVMTVPAPTAEVVGVRKVTIYLPRLVGGQGVLKTFPLPLNERVNRSACVPAPPSSVTPSTNWGSTDLRRMNQVADQQEKKVSRR
jgi:malate/lactate dehydrogenase